MPSVLSAIISSMTEKKPDKILPQFKDIGAIQQETTAGNLAVLPSAQDLASKVNLFNENQLVKWLSRNIPGYEDSQRQIGENLGSQLRGELPQDVSDLVRRTTAEGAVRGGYQGSQVADFAAAQNLGLTSLNLMQQAQTSFERWTSNTIQNTRPQMFNVASMFLSPEARLGVEDQRSMNTFLAGIRNAAIDAAPEPWQARAMNAADFIAETFLPLATMGIGGGAGAAGGAAKGMMGGGSGNGQWGGQTGGMYA